MKELPKRSAPVLGKHTHEVLLAIGHCRNWIEGLRRLGVI